MVVLVWALMVDRLSSGLSAFWATAFMVFILVTQRAILAMLRGTGGEVAVEITFEGKKYLVVPQAAILTLVREDLP